MVCIVVIGDRQRQLLQASLIDCPPCSDSSVLHTATSKVHQQTCDNESASDLNLPLHYRDSQRSIPMSVPYRSDKVTGGQSVEQRRLASPDNNNCISPLIRPVGHLLPLVRRRREIDQATEITAKNR